MLILAFDTTVAACSVALWRDGETLARARNVMEQGQAEALMPMIEDVMRQSGIAYAALDRIAVTVGPGSFTGVRVGLAAARGLGLAAGKPVIGVLTTEALAHAVPIGERKPANGRILCAVDTKRGDIYAQIFDMHLMELGAPHVLTPAQVKDAVGPHPVVVVGDAAAIAVSTLGPHAILSTAAALPDPAVIAHCAATRQPTAAGPLPVYVRPPDAVIPQHGGRLRI
jgi:tRNA threonylcarbamoyladenosine biosynthesis protein TsaB